MPGGSARPRGPHGPAPGPKGPDRFSVPGVWIQGRRPRGGWQPCWGPLRALLGGLVVVEAIAGAAGVHRGAACVPGDGQGHGLAGRGIGGPASNPGIYLQLGDIPGAGPHPAAIKAITHVVKVGRRGGDLGDDGGGDQGLDQKVAQTLISGQGEAGVVEHLHTGGSEADTRGRGKQGGIRSGPAGLTGRGLASRRAGNTRGRRGRQEDKGGRR
mmetsp:Transcript_2522/g.5617  ORF Transcript_2522/g.5617 Transcript_2522/m.5617 type:complete len:213 (-) Transcript_2522:904-1542(-)